MTTKDRGPKRGALGRGISSLLGDIDDLPDTTKSPIDIRVKSEGRKVEGQIYMLDINDVVPNPSQPRKMFDERKLRELSASLKLDGFIQPLMVTESTDEKGKYVIIAGERRWRASQLAGFGTVPAIVKEGASDDMLRLALIENIQRADLNVIEEAEAYASLIKDYGLTQEMCAERVGKDRSTVTNALRLLSLPRTIQDDIIDQKITMGHGRALLSLEDDAAIGRAREQVIARDLSVRQTELLVKEMKEKKEPPAAGIQKDPDADLEYVAQKIRNALQTKVRLVGSSNRGKIEISYFSQEDLERIVELFGDRL